MNNVFRIALLLLMHCIVVLKGHSVNTRNVFVSVQLEFKGIYVIFKIITIRQEIWLTLSSSTVFKCIWCKQKVTHHLENSLYLFNHTLHTNCHKISRNRINLCLFCYHICRNRLSIIEVEVHLLIWKLKKSLLMFQCTLHFCMTDVLFCSCFEESE